MLIRQNYLNLSPDLRKEGARLVRERIKATLADPNLSQDQKQQLKERLQKLSEWEAGTIGRVVARIPGLEEVKGMFQSVTGRSK